MPSVLQDDKPVTTGSITQQREAAFHDEWANSTRLEDVLVRESFEAPTASENQFILSKMGPLAGKRLLDLGAGLGESSVYFALQGAHVTTVDLSPQMVETALSLGRKFGVQLEGLVSGAADLDVPAESYDIIYVANTIHHVPNRPALFEKISQALKPGGMFFSYDPLAYNPLINIYRRMATAVRTPDEAPLTAADIRFGETLFRRRPAPRVLDLDPAPVREVLPRGSHPPQPGSLLEAHPPRDPLPARVVDPSPNPRPSPYPAPPCPVDGLERGHRGREAGSMMALTMPPEASPTPHPPPKRVNPGPLA